MRIDVDATSIVTNAVPAYALVGDAAVVIDGLLGALDVPARDGVARASQWRGAIAKDAQTEGGPWLNIVAAIAGVLPRETIVAGDSAMACYYGALSNLPLYRPNAFLYPTGVGTLGYGLPAGIGAKVANPDTPVVVLQGDGGIMFTIAELATAAELGITLPVIIVDNGGYGEIRNEMADRGEEVHAVALGQPDFVALAESLGCGGVRLETAADLGPALEAALKSDRPTVLHIHESSRAAEGML